MASPQDPHAVDTKALMGRALVELREARARVRRLEEAARSPIAIVGMSCRFPGGADSAAAFRELLWNGVDAIERVPADRWDAAAYFDADPDAEGRIASPFGGFVADVGRFDAEFFGVSPREADSMDPQHRLLLETTWHALEHANMPPAQLRGTDTGVFAGICTYDYAIRHLTGGASPVTAHFGTGNALSAAAGRLSYLFGFNGPSMSVDTACSSSLVSVHLAVQSLRHGECSTAVAAGVNLILAPQTTIGFSRAHMLAADGRCKPFDAAANGYVRGEGCGAVILKRLEDAQRDGDPILAVIRGSAINQDGASSGLTVPNGPAQQDVMRKAIANAGVRAAEVAYVETHGTGTALGDPIEARSLGEVYGAARGDAPLLIGSVKSNIGHLEGAAGVASLIKTVLALQDGTIPPTLHFARPSSAIDWAAARLEVASEVRPWPSGAPKMAGVSSFGFTGTNAHVIVEAAPTVPAGSRRGGSVMVPVSAADPDVLRRLAGEYRALIARSPDSIEDIAAVAALGRQHFRHRQAIVIGVGDDVSRIAARYEAGEELQWQQLHDPAARARARAPEYPFAGTRHWLAERAQESPSTPQRFRSSLSAAGPQGFGDHRVFGRVIVPAAALVDLILRAARELTGAESLTIEGFDISRALGLPDEGSRDVETILERDGAGGYRATIVTSGEAPVATALVRVAAAGGRPPAPAFPALPDAGDAYPIDLIYRECRARGLEYGDSYRTLTRVLRREASVHAEIGVAARLHHDDSHLEPPLLDGCLQAAAVAYPELPAGRLYLPVSIRRLTVFARSAGAVWSQATVTAASASRVEVDLIVFAPSGEPIAAAEGVVLVAADPLSLDAATSGMPLRRLVPVWRAREQTPLAPVAAERVAVLHAEGRDASALCDALVAAGHTVDTGDLHATSVANAADRLVVFCPTLASTADVPQLLTLLRDVLSGVARRARPPRRVLVVTEGAQPVTGAAPAVELAAVAGLVRSAQAEQPGVSLLCIDVDPGRDCSPQLVADLFDPQAAESAYRGGVRYLREFDEAIDTAEATPRLRPDRSYVVSGGLGDVGLHVARWLVERGARTLVLLGRRKPDEPQARALEALRRVADVRVQQVDVARAEQVERFFARAAAELPPIAAIVHAAGVTRDAALANLTAADFEAAWQPKVDGALNLVRHARPLGLDAFVCIGSIAGTFGAAGQANYAAANAWLEAFVTLAGGEGIPAKCISYGPWSETGLTRALSVAARRAIESRGVAFHAADAALRELARLWTSRDTHRVVYAGALPGAPSAVLTSRDAAAQPVAEGVRAIAASILGARPDRVDPEAALVSLGLDSLMALELRSRCLEQYGIDIPAVDLVSDASVADIVARIERGTGASVPRAAAAEEPMEAPLSEGQRALWYLHQLQPESPAYNIAFAVRVRSAIDRRRFAERLRGLTRRHAQLRRVYRQTDDGLRQVLHPESREVFAEYDVAALDDAAMRQRVAAEYRRPFDLSAGPLFRAALFTRAADDHVLLLAMHHIAGDAWSLWQMLEELREDAPAASSDHSYVDHVDAQQAYLRSPAADADWQFWRDELAGELPILTLPTDRSRPAVQTLNGASVPFSLSREESAALQAIARREGTTLYAVLLAAFQALLHRWSGQDDILVGCPTSGRDRAGARATVGYFVNPIVMRGRFPEGQSFLDHLRDTRTRLLQGMAHQAMPFPVIAERLGAARHPGHPPVFQAAFVMQQQQDGSGLASLMAPSTPPVQVAWGGLRLEHYFLPQQEGQFDLTLEMVQAHDACHGLLKYNSDLWDGATLRRMASHFTTLLRGVVRNPAAGVDAIDMLPADERTALRDAANGPSREYALAWPLHRWIEDQVERTPTAIAVECDGATLTYAALNASANRLARELQAHGVGPGVLVPICAERGLALVVGLLAAVKAGGAYVPLDPSYPPDRLRHMVADTAAPVVLAEPRTRAQAERAAAGTRVIAIDDPHEAWPQHPDGNLPFNGTPDTPAYAIYTSGSTGLPKGAINSHRGIVNRLCWMQEAFVLTPADRVLQKTPYSFDVSVWEFFWPLMAGARLVLARPDGHRDNAYLSRLIRDAGITTLHFVPPMLQAFLDEPDATECRVLRRVICSGQELPATLQRRFFELLPGTELHNLYGPTEAAVDVTWHRCAPGDPRASVPLGRPIANTAIYILDRLRQPVPFGVAGELFIGGVQVGRGYLNRPELTAERFIADPFAAPGATMYRSGDLARMLPDGEIEFLGRTDFQVKIRGLRVELGEIEHAIASHPGVREAVVLLREDRPAAPRLVAYVVPAAGGNDAIVGELRQALTASLPAYMMPEGFVCLDALPLTSNGKVDRRALPAPAVSTVASRAPITAAERTLADVWKAVLGVTEVGADDNFFTLGGDSIRSTQLVAAARRAGIELTVRDVLAYPTVAALAALRPVVGPPDVLERAADDTTGAIPLLPMQRRFLRAAAARFEQSIVLHAPAPLEPDVLRSALADLVQRHDALRLRFHTGPDGVQTQVLVDAAGAPIALGPASLNIASGPVAAVSLDASGTALHFTAHHLIVDGASWRTLVRDLEVAYRARQAAEAPVFPEPAASFTRWAHAVDAFAQTDAAAAEAVYWLAEDWTRGPAALPRRTQPGEGAAAGEIAIELPFEPLPGERAQAMLLAALATAVDPASPAMSLRVDLEGHGRDPLPGADGSTVVGWCTSLYPVLIDVEGASLADRAAAVARGLAEVPAGGRAFGICRDLSRRARLGSALAAIRPADILFNYLGRIDGAIMAGGLFSAVGLPDASAARDASDRPAYPLEVNAYQQADRLHLAIRFDRAHLDDAWVAAFAERYRATLADASSDSYPLTPMQQGILFHALLQPAAGLYVQQLVATFDGAPQLEILCPAWDAVLARHAVLRNSFRWKGLDAPVQQPAGQVSMPWDVHDWRVKSPAEFEAALEEALAADRRDGIDLGVSPLHRVQLFLRPDGFVMLWTHHHILLDGRGMFLVLHEALEIARAEAKHRTPELPPASSFRQFASDQAAADPAGARRYWTGELEGFDAPTPIPFLGRAGDAPYDSHEAIRSLTPDEAEALRRRARAAGVSLGLLCQSMLAVHLSHLAGSERVLFGTTTAAELANEAALGLYINTVPVAAAVPMARSVDEWLQQERGRLAERSPFEHAGLADVQRCSRLAPGDPLFDLLFLFDNYPLHDALRQPAAGATLRDVRVVERTNYPLVLSILPGDRIDVRLQHDAARYTDAAAASFLDRFVSLLRTVARAPGTAPIATLARVDGDTRDTLLYKWNETQVDLPNVCVHELIQQQAARTPDATAIRAAGGSTSYRALDARAREIAADLRGRNIGRGSVVALCTGRTADTVAALLGILYAGAAYLPLDPAFPAERLAYMLEDSGAALTLCDNTPATALLDRLAAIAPLVPLATTGGTAPAVASEPARPADLMYVLYTSGSTGRPKGVLVPHHAAVNFLIATESNPGLAQDDVMLAVTTLSFDIAVMEIFLPLSVGATVVMAEHAADPRHILRLLHDERVTVMQATPATFRLLIEAGWQRRAGLRVFSGGEALPRDLSRGILQRCDRLWNLYGPTETTVWSLACELHDSERDAQGIEPIGRPLANTQVYILDQQLEPVAVGATGELYLGGAGVTDGYRGNAALTAAQFVPDPFGRKAGARMYRTGDRARWQPDGTVEFLGRLDQQVKIRGYRIELGEIESVLGAHPDVGHAVAVVREDVPGDAMLVTYVTLRDGAAFEEAALREFLRVRVPDYMVPSRVVRLDAIPRTPNHKVDRRSLPAPAAAVGTVVRGAETPLEEALTDILGDVLHQASIPVDVSFFELGGHSLHLFQAQTRIAQRLGVDVEIIEFFRHTTVRALARLIARLQQGDAPGGGAVRDRAETRLTQADAREQRMQARRDARAARPQP